MYVLFHQTFFTESVRFSLTFLKHRILYRKLNEEIDVEQGENDLYSDKREYLYKENVDDNPKVFIETVESLKLKSPFQLYFDDLINNYAVSTKNENEAPKTTILNEFFCPQLFRIIHLMFYLLPYWSSLMLEGQDLKGQTRLNNNIVENWFDYVKNQRLEKQLVYPSQLAGSLYKRLIVKFFQFYLNYERKDIAVKQQSIKQIEENFKKPKKDYTKEKGVYYRNINLFNSWETDVSSKMPRVNQTSFNEAFMCIFNITSLMYSNINFILFKVLLMITRSFL